MRNSSEGFWLTMLMFIVMIVIFVLTFRHVHGESETLVSFQARCESDNGVVISSIKGLTCIQKEAILFTEK